MQPNISMCDYVCVCVVFGNNDKRAHTLGVSGLHLWEMMLSRQSQQTDVGALLKEMPSGPWGLGEGYE